jgi:hypothetical protein
MNLLKCPGLCGCFFCFLTVIMLFQPQEIFSNQEEIAPGRTMAQQAVKEKKVWITADHSKFEALKKAFTSGPEVTAACLSCHTEAGLQFHRTIHWTWLDPATQETTKLGKRGLSINNF